MTDRLRACLDAGDVVALFPLLKDWPEVELLALIADVEAFHEESAKSLEVGHRELAFKPENFLSRARSKALDTAVKGKDMELMAMSSEIISVALFYLEEKEPTLEHARRRSESR